MVNPSWLRLALSAIIGLILAVGIVLPVAAAAADAEVAGEAAAGADARETDETASETEAETKTRAEAEAVKLVVGGTVDKDVEVVTVTATKRPESFQEVAVSMAALNSDSLEKSGITQFGQLQQYVPNLTINPVTDTRGTVIRIRGIGSPGTNAGIDPSVGVFIDGIYQGRAGMSVGDLLDIERVEVLRGPQGTLYGKNTAAGLINVISKRPSYEWESMVESVLGNYETVELRGSANVPIVDDHIAARLSAYWTTRDGFDRLLNVDGRSFEADSGRPIDPNLAPGARVIEDGRVNDNDKWGAKGRLLFDINDSFSFLLSGDYSMEDSTCCVADIKKFDGDPTLVSTLTFQSLAGPYNRPPPFTTFHGTEIPLPSDDGYDRIVSANQEPRNIVKIGGVSADASYELPDMSWIGGSTLNAIGSWRTSSSDSQFDGDFSYYDAVLAYTLEDLDQYSAELRFTSPGSQFVDYQTGFYFYHLDLNTVDRNGFEWDLVNLFPSTGGPTLNVGDNNHQTWSYGGFGQATVNLHEQLSVTGGARVTYEKKARVGTQTSRVWRNIGGVWQYALPIIEAPPIIGPDTYKDEERALTNVSGMANIRYTPTQEIMVYTSFATGFKSGGFNQLRTLDDPDVRSDFDDEESTSYEIGLRTTWFDRLITFNITGFYTNYDEFQAQLFDGSAINVVNAGSLRSYGTEADLVLLPYEGLVIGSSVGFNIAEYTDFKNGLETASQKYQETGGFPSSCNGALPPGATYDCVQDLTGETLDNAPVWTVSVFSDYEYPLPPMPEITLFTRIEYSFMSERYLDTDLDPNLLQDSTHLLNLRLGARIHPYWDWLNGFGREVEVTAWVRNVTQEKWAVVGFDVPTLNGFAIVNGPPRQYGITTRITF